MQNKQMRIVVGDCALVMSNSFQSMGIKSNENNKSRFKASAAGFVITHAHSRNSN